MHFSEHFFVLIKFVTSVAQIVRWEGALGWEGLEWANFLCFVKFALDGEDVNE